MATSINVKMYRVGELGDCFLLTLTHDTTIKHILIDCGSFRNGKVSKDRLKEIVANIKDKQLKGRKLDIVVGTHQHNDHVSGFVHEESTFRQIGIEQVWLSWLDNPKNEQAVKIGENHIAFRKSLKLVSDKLPSLYRKSGNSFGLKARATKNLIDDLLGFYGAAPELPAKGIKILKDIGNKNADYLLPGKIMTIPGIPASEIRVFILGPPENEELLYRKNPRKGESYDHKLRALNAMAGHFMAALDNKIKNADKEEEQFPFNMDYKKLLDKPKTFSYDLQKIRKLYNSRQDNWRKIDEDWLEQASRLALYMDTFTNNSSLVLAIELVKKGKVLLFAADAQTGNWISWNKLKFNDDETVTIDSLLDRTVLYKVGHHGSHNSTLKDALEKMNNEELVAMIPVEKTDPNITKVDGWKMPAPNLYKRLKEKTHNRVLRMDDGFADQCNPNTSAKAKASWGKVSQPKVAPLFIEYSIS